MDGNVPVFVAGIKGNGRVPGRVHSPFLLPEIWVDSVGRRANLLVMSNQVSAPHRVCFPANDVPPSTKPLATTTIKAALERTLRSPLVVCPELSERVVEG